MKRSELWYELPDALIAAAPVEPRDQARLLVLDRDTGELRHRRFADLPELLAPGDVLVFNDTRVIPARFFCHRATGARVEGLFVREEEDCWRVLLKGGKRLRAGERLTFAAPTSPSLIKTGTDSNSVDPLPGPEVELVERAERGEWRVRPTVAAAAMAILDAYGEPPLPPYIRARRRESGKDEATESDPTSYQTVYAARPGAVAAPTAGLHFTPRLLDAIAARGVEQCFVTLHVGLGTFAPIEVDDLADHTMHEEWFEISATARQQLAAAKARNSRVIAVGTTSCRVLESLARRTANSETATTNEGAISGWTNLFLYPPADFKLVDALITNFHLPESTLIAMVMAFAGIEQTRRAYDTAIEHNYRFYSYGDGMLIA